MKKDDNLSRAYMLLTTGCEEDVTDVVNNLNIYLKKASK